MQGLKGYWIFLGLEERRGALGVLGGGAGTPYPAAPQGSHGALDATAGDRSCHCKQGLRPLAAMLNGDREGRTVLGRDGAQPGACSGAWSRGKAQTCSEPANLERMLQCSAPLN